MKTLSDRLKSRQAWLVGRCPVEAIENLKVSENSQIDLPILRNQAVLTPLISRIGILATPPAGQCQ
ncbi:MAG: hypothetical protein ACI9H8_000627 [Lysobacterales bacterium]|jgi:hypothetical protein